MAAWRACSSDIPLGIKSFPVSCVIRIHREYGEGRHSQLVAQTDLILYPTHLTDSVKHRQSPRLSDWAEKAWRLCAGCCSGSVHWKVLAWASRVLLVLASPIPISVNQASNQLQFLQQLDYIVEKKVEGVLTTAPDKSQSMASCESEKLMAAFRDGSASKPMAVRSLKTLSFILPDILNDGCTDLVC